MSSYIMSQAIADYIIEVLGNTQGPLDAIKIFVRGALGPGQIPQDHYPFCEVFVGEEIEGPEGTGVYYGQVYPGQLVFFITLANETSADQLVKIGERIVHVPSYDIAKEFVHAAVFELQKGEHRDMGNLRIGDEAVVQFTVSGPRILGIDRDLRSNNWDNFAIVPFEVRTDRIR